MKNSKNPNSLSNIRSIPLIKQYIIPYIPVKRFLDIFKSSKKYVKIFSLYPSIFELFSNIKNDFIIYNSNMKENMLYYIEHFKHKQKYISKSIIKDYFFRYLLEQSKICVEFDDENFEELLMFLEKSKYKGELIIIISEPKRDLNDYPNIDQYNEKILFDIELYVLLSWESREKTSNIPYIKDLLIKKISLEVREKIKKILFLEYLDLDIETQEDLFFDLKDIFPNALFNIQNKYENDINFWKSLEKFNSNKIVIDKDIDIDYEEKERNENKIFINDINNNDIIENENINSDIINKNDNKIEIYKEDISDMLNKEKDREGNKENFDINIGNFKEEQINKINQINEKSLDTLMENTNNIENIQSISNINEQNILDNQNTLINYNDSNNFNNNNNCINNIYNNCISDNIIQKHISFQMKLSSILSQIPNLKKLVLDLGKKDIKICDTYIKNVKNLTEFSIGNFLYNKNESILTEFIPKDIKKLGIFQKFFNLNTDILTININFSSLKELRLGKIKILENNLVEIINKNKFLENFEFAKNYNSFGYGKKLAKALSNLNNLYFLSTDGFNKSEKISEFYLNLSSNSLKCISISNENNLYVGKIGKNCKNLVRLAVDSCTICYDNNDFEHDIFKKLTHLNVYKTENLEVFYKYIALKDRLDEFTYEYFSKEFFPTLSEYGRNMKKLYSLSIVPDIFKRIKYDEISKFLVSICSYKNLVVLKLGFYTISEYTFNTLYNVLSKLSFLRYIKLTIENIVPSLKNKFEEKMNKLKEINKENKLFVEIIYINKRF